MPKNWLKNILITGNIGNGKSTLCNLLSGNKNLAIARKSTTTQTLGLDAYSLPNLAGGVRILDTQGVGCPNYSDLMLYRKLCINMLKKYDPNGKGDENEKLKKYAAIKSEGINSIVTPILIPVSDRISNEQINVLFNTVMIF